MAPPTAFVDLATAQRTVNDSFVNIIGIVVDIQHPTVTKTGQTMFTFKLLDETLSNSLYGSQGLTVRFFRESTQNLPQIRDRGDIVLLRDIKMSSFNQQPMALSNYGTRTLVFPGASIPEPTWQIAYNDKKRIECLGVPLDVSSVRLEEQSYVIQLKHDMQSCLANLGPPRTAPTGPAAMRQQQNAPAYPTLARKRPGADLPTTAPKKLKQTSFGPKFKTVHDLQHRDFADILGQVVKKFATPYGSCELYVTDYTQNNQMFYYAPPEEKNDLVRDGDEYGYNGGPAKKTWPGPYGWLVLKVNVKNPHAAYVNREVNEGDFVLLQNVKMKMKAEGVAKLEGDMWPDDLDDQRVKVRKIKTMDLPELIAIRERKERYWRARNAKIGASEQQEGKKKSTRAEKKKRKKALEAEKSAAASDQDGKQNGDTASDVQDGRSKRKTKPDLNPHVRCGHEEVPISSIKDIIDRDDKRHHNVMPDGCSYILPFVNAKLRARVRVLAFSPTQLEDFALPEQNHSYDGDQSDENSGYMDIESSSRYEWSFSLLLEDASKPKGAAENNDQLWVTLGHQEAQYLFGNAVNDPADLREDRTLLARLREKMFTLWGNLAEKAENDAISNRPFECCLMEYGVELDDDDPEKAESPFGFRRMYRMFGVTIL
ncbi:hypothetical protein LTR37_011447 [Vermiconidia calcicola]|uniref:Uncharacterized protein n=1 Tax=Vermiconidia calcicola TaxID=1690605 RepID=A0ACC3N3A6_9PEZI|nr:hypothetical protein LTR37_011447 [Vermiconidia calcicola]